MASLPRGPTPLLTSSSRWVRGIVRGSIDLDPRSRTDDTLLPWSTNGSFGGICGTHYYHDIPRRGNVPVVFVHGNSADARVWLPAMADFLERGDTGEDCWAITFRRASPSHESMAAQLDAFVAKVREYTGYDRVHVVSHSLGVTGVRYWLATYDRYDWIDTFVGLAGANHGSSRCGRFARYGLTIGPARTNKFLDPQRIDRDDHPLARLNEDETPGDVAYYTIRATRDRFFRENPRSPALDGATNEVVETDHVGLLTDEETLATMYGWLRH